MSVNVLVRSGIRIMAVAVSRDVLPQPKPLKDMTSVKIRRIFCFLLPIGGFIHMPPLSIPDVHDAFADVVPMPGPDDYPEPGDPDEAPEPFPDDTPQP